MLEVEKPCVVSLSWTLKDSLGEVLDELQEPVEFFVGGQDLLPAIETSLQGRKPGAAFSLNLEPEHAFGAYDEQLAFFLPRQDLPEGIEEGMLIEAAALPAGDRPLLPDDTLCTITEIYPDHVVLDGNHPMAGMSLRLHLKLHAIRAATAEEIQQGTVGPGFYRLQTTDAPAPDLH